MKKILIIDDHDIMRVALRTLIDTCAMCRVHDAQASLASGLASIARHRPDLVVCDMSLGDSKGLATMRAVIQAQDPRPVLMLSMHDEMIYAEQALSLGARGYLMKDRAQEFLLQAIDKLLDGDVWVSPVVTTYLLNRTMKRKSQMTDSERHKTVGHLSQREIEVLEQLGAGKATKEIARDFGLSPRTVDIHRANIKKKLGLKNSAEVLTFALSRT